MLRFYHGLRRCLFHYFGYLEISRSIKLYGALILSVKKISLAKLFKIDLIYVCTWHMEIQNNCMKFQNCHFRDFRVFFFQCFADLLDWKTNTGGINSFKTNVNFHDSSYLICQMERRRSIYCQISGWIVKASIQRATFTNAYTTQIHQICIFCLEMINWFDIMHVWTY